VARAGNGDAGSRSPARVLGSRDANTHILLLPAGLSAQRAVGIVIGTREPDEHSPWPPGDWLETETACWIRRSAIVSVRIVTRPKTATA